MTADPYDGIPPPEGEESPSLLADMFSAADLDKMEFAPLTEHVPNLIVEGFGVIAGPPKVGKSWLADGISLGCAHGGTVLGGIQVEPRSVLLMALEDGPRRLQTRMRRLNYDQPLPAKLDILTKVAPGKVISTIAEWLETHAADDVPPLVVLDTLGKARQQRRAGDDPYIADYQLGTWIKNTVDAVPGAALAAVHHTRKMGSDDFVDTISGTQGIAGSADYILVLSRKRRSDEGVLSVTGRDIEENEYAVKTEGGIWALDGMDIMDAAATVNARREQTAELKLGGRSLEIMKFVNSRSETTPALVAAHLGIDNGVAGTQLGRLHEGGYIDKLRRGTYVPIRPVESGESVESTGRGLGHPPDDSTLSTDSTADGQRGAA